MYYLILAIIAIFAIVLYMHRRRNYDLKGKHVMITGGTKGIGKCLAMIAINEGANVTVIARDSEALEQTQFELLKSSNAGKQKVTVKSLDVSGDYSDVERVISEAEEICGPINVLICCAGTAVSHRFDDTPMSEFKRMIDVNYFGTVNVIKASLPSMKNSGSGNIIIFSSIAGIFGLYGYAAYAPAKFALMGLAQVLSMELKQHNIKVTVSLPPDTDTPGFANEQITKPLETKLISDSGGLFKPEVVARKTLHDAMSGNFVSTVGFESWMLRTVCCGMMPFSSIIEVIIQAFTMGIFRIAAAVYLEKFDKIIMKCADERQLNKKSN